MLAEISRRGPVSLMLYGGFPDSPLNGGRLNFTLDGCTHPGQPLAPEMLQDLSFNRELLAWAKAEFYSTVEEANRNQIAFNLSFTNYFVEEEEINNANLEPVDRLVELGAKHGVCNGIIINSALLEARLRSRHPGSLRYISSCTKYVSPDKLLSPSETIHLYRQDIDRYDFITLTPQHSRDRFVMDRIPERHRDKVIAIVNSYCARGCNSYWHYELISHENKKSLLNYTIQDLTVSAANFSKRYARCPALTHRHRDMRLKEKVCRQLGAGIINFKIGRGLGANCLDELVGILT